jgi:pimeloyl-ACP methyl ester carboxylesterase
MKSLRDCVICFFRSFVERSDFHRCSGTSGKSKRPLNLPLAKGETKKRFAIGAPFASLLILFLSVSLFAAEPPVRRSAWQQTECSVFQIKTEGRDVECGFVTVPRRHEDPNGPAIRLATVIIKSDAEKRSPEPLFIAQGGPGGSSIKSFAQLLISSPELRPAKNRDLVLWDQRGTFFSRPALLCPEVSKAELEAMADTKNRTETEKDELQRQAYRACGERLAREAGDLSAFNTVENADDVNAIRQALGYGRIGFYGVSYGTELGQYLMRQHPAILHAVVLDAVVPTQFNLVTQVGSVKQRIAQKYFQGCEREATCREAYPDLGKRLLTLLDRLDREPAKLAIRDPKNPGKTLTVKLTGEILADALYQALYIRDVRPLIPYIIDRADHGDFTFISGLLLPLQLDNDDHAIGMYTAVVCTERGDSDPSIIRTSGFNPRLVRTELKGAQEMIGVCKDWKVELLPREVLEPVKSDVPTLLLSGDFDPITPPNFAKQIAPDLSRVQLVTFPRGAHGQAFDSPCANSIIESFLNNPTVPVNSSCAVTALSNFVVPSDLIVLPQLRAAIAEGTQKGLMSYAFRFIMVAASLVVLLTAIPVYAVVEVIACLRGRRALAGATLGARLSAAAPWLPVLALLLFAGFLVVFAAQLFATLDENKFLAFVGTVPSSLRWVFVIAWLGVLVVVLMGAAALVLWIQRQRTFVGRLYYSLLLVAGVVAVLGLWQAGLLGALFH